MTNGKIEKTVDEQVMIILRELDEQAAAIFPPMNYASIKSFLFMEVKDKLTELLKNKQ